MAVPNIAKFDPRELEENKPNDLKGLYNVDMDAFESVIQINTMGTVNVLDSIRTSGKLEQAAEQRLIEALDALRLQMSA